MTDIKRVRLTMTYATKRNLVLEAPHAGDGVGKPWTFQLDTLADPEPGPGEIRVKVSACAVLARLRQGAILGTAVLVPGA